MSVLLQTSFGDITIDLFTDKAPNACLNFLKLCKLKHYNNSLFAQIQKNYVTNVRTEHPTTIWKQTGLNLPYFKDEIDVEFKVNELGLVATANIGSNLNNSSFFITLTKANLASLTGKHTVFGKVTEGTDVLRRINDTYVDNLNQPQMNIRIMHTFVLDDPFPDLQKMRIPQRSPSPLKDSDRLQAIQHLQMLQKCKNQSEIIEETKKQKAKKQAMTLEILGDLPDASLKPPQNMLFICKLNPITQERDLQIIFSRFGPIKSVEIVRDWKTGQSLQYGFIEFDNITSCEEAYLKMNNVVIDDRRIQVDFSQSVSKLLYKNKSSGVMSHGKSRFESGNQKKRQILPKIYTEGKDKRQKYDFVLPSAIASKEQTEKIGNKYQSSNRHVSGDKKQKLIREDSVERHRDQKKSKKDKEKKKKRSRSRSQQRLRGKQRDSSEDRSRRQKKHSRKRYVSRSSQSR